MLTRRKKEKVQELQQAFLYMRGPKGTTESEDSQQRQAREVKKAERAAIRARNEWSCRRMHRAGEIKKVIELRFGSVGSVERSGTLSYREISEKLLINRHTVAKICHNYLNRGAYIRKPGQLHLV